MKRCFSVFSAVVVAVVALASVPSAMSQVIVYSVDFKHEDGFNLDFFDGGYFVAPALGGSGTFILTARDNGRKTLTRSAGTGNFFHGLDEHEKRISVVSATGGDGSASNASYVAFGDVTGTVEFATSDAIFKIKVAKKLKGYAIAASSEANTTGSSSTATDTTTDTVTDTTTTTDPTTSTGSTSSTSSSTDGTIGFAAISSMTLTLDEGHTERSNELDQTQEQAVASLAVELQQKGYVDSSSATTGTGTGTSTGTGTTTGTTTAATPEMAVTQGVNIADGGTKDFGTVAVGLTADLVFIISNTGGADLTGLTITIDGANGSEFTVAAAPTAPVTGPTGSTTFTVRFTPTSAGAKTAAIHISNNDSDENPYDITLTGSGS